MSWLPDWLTGYDAANADKAAAADAIIQEQNAINYAPGGKYYSPANAQAVEAQRAAEIAAGGYGTSAQRAQIDGAFSDGLQTGIANVRNTISGILTNAFKLLPWWLWLAILAVAFFYLGGGELIRAQVKKAAAK